MSEKTVRIIKGKIKEVYVHIEDWCNRPLQKDKYPYIYTDDIYLRRNQGGEFEDVAIQVAIRKAALWGFARIRQLSFYRQWCAAGRDMTAEYAEALRD